MIWPAELIVVKEIAGRRIEANDYFRSSLGGAPQIVEHIGPFDASCLPPLYSTLVWTWVTDSRDIINLVTKHNNSGRPGTACAWYIFDPLERDGGPVRCAIT